PPPSPIYPLSLHDALPICPSTLFPGFAAVGLLFLCSFATASADPSNGTVASRSAKVDGLDFHYLSAGKGPALILLHGYAETSRIDRKSTRLNSSHDQISYA